ncbi:mannose-1-phosphate guanylyltransferase / mannose-6-phosphate isomerase [Psychrobacillus psychrodurans]|uniref:CBS domain-containing protein n=1 Tax=Psychrobacillus sp. FSL K6-1415 TaxID=2921544 RepID=UPI0008ED4506|nr:CBS domain-containing protein [Psychrobacillus psychrodurans]SFM33849.1 mannose-1-phosphate guanylyltransferase / mannose-6-phosphate isomerase [Psychrobacillus psychrodurans]
MYKNYIAEEQATILDALTIIDRNQKGFVVVTDTYNKVIGTLTDGDIRRALIEGISLSSKVSEVVNSNFKSIRENDEFETVVNIFKDSKIEFLPIINEEKVLLNVVTKKQLHIILLEDSKWQPNRDFSLLDDEKLEQEIYNRPWGYYKTVFLSDFTRAKIICVYPKGKLSIQEHKYREEHWVIVKGKGELTLGESIKSMTSGDYIFVPKSCKHSIENISDEENLFISEVQLGSYFGEDDIIRYSDIYGRV